MLKWVNVGFFGPLFSYCVCVYVQVLHQLSGLSPTAPKLHCRVYFEYLCLRAEKVMTVRKEGGDCKTAFRTTSYTKNDVLVSSSQVASSGFLSSVRRQSIALMFSLYLFKGKYFFNEKRKEMEPMMQTAKRGNIIDLLCFFFQDTNFNMVA